MNKCGHLGIERSARNMVFSLMNAQKIEFSSSIELVVTMGALAIGMWWLFDRSRGGLGLSIAFTLLSTALTHLLLNPSALT